MRPYVQIIGDDAGAMRFFLYLCAMTEIEYRYIWNSLIIVMFIVAIAMSPGKLHVKSPIGWFFVLVLSLYVGLRDTRIGIDTEVYMSMFDLISQYDFRDLDEPQDYTRLEIGFVWFNKIVSLLFDFRTLLVLTALITNSFFYLFCCRLCNAVKGVTNPLAMFACLLTAFYVSTMEYNIIRAGLSMAFLLNFYISLFDNDKRGVIPYGLLAYLLHTSALLGILSALLAKFVRLDRFSCLALFVVVAVLSYAGASFLDIPGITETDFGKASSYINNASETDYIIGFRTGFFIFNAFFMVLFTGFYQFGYTSYRLFYRLFVYSSCAFFLSFTIPFSDRIGAFSWVAIPIVTYILFHNIFPRHHIFAQTTCFVFLFMVGYGINFLT